MSTYNHVPVLSRLLHLNAKVAKKRCKRGLAYLIELASKANNWIHCSRLRNLFNLPGNGSAEMQTAFITRNDGEELNFSIGSSELPINAIDEQTLIAVRNRLRRILQALGEIASWNDYAQVDDLLEEKEKLVEYLKDSVSSHGKIKAINSRTHADYRAVYQAISRTIKEISKVEPDLAAEINQHLITGIYFMWKEVI